MVGHEVVIGRSPDCHITIEDPLVSRRHARLTIDGEKAFVQDLGSRNGVRVNGRSIEGKTELVDGSRVRIGTQELILYTVERRARKARTTGFMCVCQACGKPYPEEAPACPHCGTAADPADEDTISGLMVSPQRSWTFQLLGEVIERALEQRRATEAERILRRAAREVDERIEAGDKMDPAQVAMVAGFALRLANMADDAAWLAWAFNVYRRSELAPEAAFLDQVEAASVVQMPDARLAAAELATWARGAGAGCADRLDALARG